MRSFVSTANMVSLFNVCLYVSSNVVTFIVGQASGAIVIDILSDDLAETDEFLVVLLTKVTPEDTQRLRPGAARITVVISENDNPGGTFEFGLGVEQSYVVRVSKFKAKFFISQLKYGIYITAFICTVYL